VPLEADYRDAEFLACDLETTGLKPDRDEIVSVGWVVVRSGRVRLAEASELVVRTNRSVGGSATVHGLLDDALQNGVRLEEALGAFLAALSSRVLLVHHAPLELGFLNAACKRLYGVPLHAQVVDTLELAARRMRQKGLEAREGDLRLPNLRARYSLPRYRTHGALSDALGTAELFLALAAELAGTGKLPLRRLLR